MSAASRRCSLNCSDRLPCSPETHPTVQPEGSGRPEPTKYLGPIWSSTRRYCAATIAFATRSRRSSVGPLFNFAPRTPYASSNGPSCGATGSSWSSTWPRRRFRTACATAATLICSPSHGWPRNTNRCPISTKRTRGRSTPYRSPIFWACSRRSSGSRCSLLLDRQSPAAYSSRHSHRSECPMTRVMSAGGRASLGMLLVASLILPLAVRAAHAQRGGGGRGAAGGNGRAGGPPPDTTRGFPITERAIVGNCIGCHKQDSAGVVQRISFERKTPEGWEMSVRRMVGLHHLDLDPKDARTIVRYLSDH